MKTIMTHPSNVRELKKTLAAESSFRGGEFSMSPFSIYGCDIVECPDMVAMRHSGKYVLPDGRVVFPSEVRINSRFFDYGPEDTSFLLMAGIIKKHMERNFMVIDDRFLMPKMMPSLYPPILSLSYC